MKASYVALACSILVACQPDGPRTPRPKARKAVITETALPESFTEKKAEEAARAVPPTAARAGEPASSPESEAKAEAHLAPEGEAAAASPGEEPAADGGAGEAAAEAALAQAAPDTATPESEAKIFLSKTNQDLKELWSHWERTEWVKSTHITHDTEVLAAKAREEVMAYTAGAVAEASQFASETLDAETARALHLLKVSLSLPAPSDPDKRKNLAQIATRLGSTYGKGKYCSSPDNCRDLGALSATIADSNATYEDKLEAWKGWRSISVPMRGDYQSFVELGNAGAKEVGFEDLGQLWRSSYDMSPSEFEAEVERLWNQVKPLYEQLHCYVRAKLSERYGEDKVSPTGKIPAHLLGNMWAQEWGNIFPLVTPYPDAKSIDVTAALQSGNYKPKDLVKMAERFFTSLNLNALPDTFWERSMFTKPRDREVVCHASAWDVTFSNDLRIKMCIKVDYEDFVTVHHELGHNYYYMYYNQLPALYQSGAHDGFHEGIGDTLALSVTPGYLRTIGILKEDAERSEEALINLMMQNALDKIAFLPFGRMIDQWRWDVFSGKIDKDDYNAAWWALREKYQGIEAPVARTEADFDPGAKYHIPGNTPYIRYFLARILQFQFHRALCEAAGHNGPLHECSIYGSAQAGKKLQAMLALGASKPWPDALEALTGSREMDASAMVDYFQPLSNWLAESNKERTCGW